MLKKIFSSAHNILLGEHPQKAQIERDLASLSVQLQETRWVALVTSDGVLRGIFPSQPGIGEDRISAMSAAMLSLGERITRELENGKLRYNIMAGDEGVALMLVLSQDYVLAVGFNREISAQTVFEKLRESIAPLLKTLQIESLPWLYNTRIH
jgi:predicted regulator of Ras-like GTPase activity (Roadblock/LC7/MglB family)